MSVCAWNISSDFGIKIALNICNYKNFLLLESKVAN